MKIVIIGGYGGMGRLFAKLFREEGCDVIVTGRTESKGRKAEKELGVKYMKDNKKASAEGDVVIVTVPIDVTIETIKEVAPCVKKGSLLMDFTSVKTEPCRAMDEFSDNAVNVIGTHPMFGPRVSSLEGQVFILTPIRTTKKWMKWITGFLEKHNARIIVSNPQEHDDMLAVVQGLTHFAYISIGKTLHDLDFDIKRSREFSSPIYELMLDIVGRIIGQDPHLYASIQVQNPRVLDVHKAFFKAAGELSDMVRKRDTERFVEIMSKSAKHFDDVDAAMGRSDKAIASLVSELKQLKKGIGKEVALKHIYSGNVHIGVVKDIDPEFVVIDESGVSRRLKISNITLLDDKERIKHKAERSGTIKRDFSHIFDKEVDENFIAQLLEEFNEGIIAVKVKDVYAGKQIPGGRKSVCFRVSLVNSDVKITEKEINKFFKRIGGVSR